MQGKLTYSRMPRSLMTIWSSVGTSTKRVWWFWCTALVVIFFIQFLTLDTLFLFYKDQAQIIDYGRLALNPDSNWSITWLVSKDKPLLLWSYLGPLIAESSFLLGNYTSSGPRIASLVGGLVAATMALGWLLARKVPTYAAVGLCLAFSLDPLLLVSQRTGRVDSWVIAFCLACCWILRGNIVKDSDFLFKVKLMSAGAFAAAAALIWPSAVFLYPLIFLELIQLGKSEDVLKSKLKFLAIKVFYFGAGGLVTLTILLIPIWQNLILIFSDMTTVVTSNTDSSKKISNILFAAFDYQLWLKLTKTFVKTSSPIFPLFALAGMIINRDRGLILVTIVTIILIFSSLIYEFRTLYLIPYFLVLSSGLFSKAKIGLPRPLFDRYIRIALFTLVLWSSGISLFARTAFGLQNNLGLIQDKIFKVSSSSIGSGSYKVFLGFTYEFYFVGRSLGWQLYAPYVQYVYDSQGNWINDNPYGPKDKFVALLSKMDYAVFQQADISRELSEQLTISGLYRMTSFSTNNNNITVELPQNQSRYLQIFLRILKGEASHGSYVLYARERCDSNKYSASLILKD